MEMYTGTEVRKIFKIHENTLYSWIRTGKIKPIRVGKQGRYRFLKADIDKMLESDK